MIIKELTEQECTAVLRASSLGYLACAKDGRPYVVPITFAFADHGIYSFSMLGQKIEWMRENPQVCLQVGDFDAGRDGKASWFRAPMKNCRTASDRNGSATMPGRC